MMTSPLLKYSFKFVVRKFAGQPRKNKTTSILVGH